MVDYVIIDSNQKPIENIKIIKEILYEASFSPSGSNTQPWNVHVLTGNKLKDFTIKSKKEFAASSNEYELNFNSP